MLSYDKIIAAHPHNIDYIRSTFRKTTVKTGDGFNLSYKLIANDSLPIYCKKWVFPKEQFWEYDKSNEDWCRYFGFGHEEDDLSSFYYLIINERLFQTNFNQRGAISEYVEEPDATNKV
jgi:hypothetical protein